MGNTHKAAEGLFESDADVQEEENVTQKIQTETSDQDVHKKLMAELDGLIERVREATPGFEPPQFTPERLMERVKKELKHYTPDIQLGILKKLRGTINEDLLDIDTWKGIWYMLSYTAEYQTGFVKEQWRGENATDEWGMDWELRQVVRPFFEFLYGNYFRVEVTGIENIPDEGRGLIVGNHSGQLPWDGVMVAAAVEVEHPEERIVRTLFATWFPTLPFLSAFMVRLGGATATVENATRLLEQDELVAVYPEGYKGVSKLFRHRYQLARFGRGGFVKMALNAKASIIPVSVVGAEETYIAIHKSNTLAKLVGTPYFPISLRFPLFGLFGFIPLPTKWYIDFGEPIPMDGYGDDASNNLLLVTRLSDKVRGIVQQMINKRLGKRKSVFFSS
ncbi:MAG: hypothetical protein B6242_05865 [Anaerolineaceae bacterium 4572_78]|nr:MAG: hypothetical protein B6242_05865 [Anaerolineaceae bacterium 4572_78]